MVSDIVMIELLLKSACHVGNLSDLVIARDKRFVKELTRRANEVGEDFETYIRRYFKEEVK